MARGEFMRYFAETAWYPTALLPSQGVRWQAVDSASAHATIVDGRIALILLFGFNDAGLISSVRAVSRGAGVGKIRPEGRKVYFHGTVKTLACEWATGAPR